MRPCGRRLGQEPVDNMAIRTGRGDRVQNADRPPFDLYAARRACLTPKRKVIHDVLREERSVDRSPGHVVAALLDEGKNLASERTFCRVLAKYNEPR